MVTSRLDELTPPALAVAGFPTSYDLVVCVGNVMILLAPETERPVLARPRRAAGARRPDAGRIPPEDAPAPTARSYPIGEFAEDCAAVGLVVEARYASYDLAPFTEDSDYVVHACCGSRPVRVMVSDR